MKHLVFALAFLAATTVCMNAQNASDLWKQVEKAEKAGKPQTSAQYLKQLEKAALEKGDELEHYHIAQKLYEALSRYDWKEANSYYSTYSGARKALFDNLDESLARYAGHPREIILQYEKVLRHRSSIWSKGNKATGEDWRALRKECQELLSKTSDKDYRKRLEDLVGDLDSKYLYCGTEDQVAPCSYAGLSLSSKNISKVTVSLYKLDDGVSFIYGGEKKALQNLKRHSTFISSKQFTGFKNEYSIQEDSKDSVYVPGPGAYAVHLSGDGKECFTTLNASSVAGALRLRNDKLEIYAAELMTGKPLESVKARCFANSGKKTEDAIFRQETVLSLDCRLDGFTPADIESRLDKESRFAVRLETPQDNGAPMLEIPQWDYGSRPRNSVNPTREQAFIVSDRNLYKTDDTIRFKVICYSSDGTSGQVESGREVEVSLRHEKDRKAASSAILVTNDMGSASGEFLLPADARHGRYFIEVKDICSKSVRVEEYKRPSFNVELCPGTDVNCFGEVVSQTGRIFSHAGYPVAGAKVEYTIIRNNLFRKCPTPWFEQDTVAQGSVLSGNDGSFEIVFTAERPQTVENPDESDAGMMAASYRVMVKATDKAGETQESACSLPVSDMPLEMDISLAEKHSFENTVIVDKLSSQGFTIRTSTLNGSPYQMRGVYELSHNGRLYRKDNFSSNEEIFCPFEDMPSGKYSLKARSEFRGRAVESSRDFILISSNDVKSPVEARYFYCPVKTEGGIEFLIGTTEKDLYLNLELLDGHRRLYREAVHLQDEMRLFNLPFLKEYGTAVTVGIFGIRDAKVISESHVFTNPQTCKFDMAFTSLRDKTAPESVEKISFHSLPGSEAVLTIYDTTNDRLQRNSFEFHPLLSSMAKDIPHVHCSGSRYYSVMNDGLAVRSYGVKMAKAEGANALEEEAPANDASDMEENGALQLRSEFNETLAFFPHIGVGTDSTATVEFRTNGLLGTFKVMAMAHDKQLLTGNAETSFIVQKPLMVRPQLPLSVREGDHIILKAGIINVSDKEVRGNARIEITDQDGNKVRTADSQDKKVTLLSQAQTVAEWSLDVPAAKSLTVTISFSDGKVSDGEINVMEVEPDVVTLTEAASFIIGQGKDFKYYEKLLKKQYKQFNPTIARAEYSAMDAVKEALSKAVKPQHDNAIEWMNQLYVNQMRAAVMQGDEDILFRSQAFAKLASLQGSDGAFRWFEGMQASETVTLYILEKIAQMRENGAIVLNGNESAVVDRALSYLDSRIERLCSLKNVSCFSMIRMMAVRTAWLDRPLCGKAGEGLKDFLAATEEGWQNISILEKAQLCRTLARCGSTEYGSRQMKSRIKALLESLEDHAVKNPAAGCYFPNAVMPFRGLMNNEIYAHAQLAETFASMGEGKMAEGLVQWLLLQKHNQAWENTVATADAVNAILKGNVKDLRFGAVYCTYTTKFENVKPSANEISVERSFTRASDGKQLKDGDILNIGDQIIAHYRIHNTENRSFVQMKAMRPASFYPKDERSSYSWAGFYREVNASQTNYWWELLPEEETVVEERFYVTQEGVFSNALVEIDCLYAPEYRGHTGSGTTTVSED